VRFSTKILIAPLRPAALLAKTVATLDALSRGRVELGVATGWQREEYAAQGLDWARRGALLTETIEVCRALWSGEPARFASPTLRLDGVVCAPRPVQARIPVWFAGRLHACNLERICRLGDGWIPEPYSPPETLARGLPALREAWARAGRDPGALGVQGDLDALAGPDGRPDLRRSLEALPRWIEAGATTLNVVLSLFAGRRRAAAFFEALAREWPAAAGRADREG
jgi:probable F420-dependent oxidoreductase